MGNTWNYIAVDEWWCWVVLGLLVIGLYLAWYFLDKITTRLEWIGRAEDRQTDALNGLQDLIRKRRKARKK